MDRLALDTTFLIDLQNDRRGRGRPTGARSFLSARQSVEFYLPVIARGEYLEGFADPDSPEALRLVDGLRTLNVTAEVSRTYATVTRQLRRSGNLIGANDLWIGCTARTANLAVVTRNPDEFRRIPGLKVLEYAP